MHYSPVDYWTVAVYPRWRAREPYPRFARARWRPDFEPPAPIAGTPEEVFTGPRRGRTFFGESRGRTYTSERRGCTFAAGDK